MQTLVCAGSRPIERERDAARARTVRMTDGWPFSSEGDGSESNSLLVMLETKFRLPALIT
jgi:hypothetical protein